MIRFQGTDRYVAAEDLMLAVNAAITLERPLLIKGEPGTGKTMLAEEVARALDAPLLEWHIKSNTKAQQGLYEYDAVSRLRDSQLGNEKVHDIANYIKPGALWNAFVHEQRCVPLLSQLAGSHGPRRAGAHHQAIPGSSGCLLHIERGRRSRAKRSQ